MTRIMWIYDSQYGPHESNYGDLWFETVGLWLKRPGHCSETPDLWIERPGHCSEIPDLWFEIRDAWLEIYGFMIRSTGRMNRNTVGLGLDRPGHCWDWSIVPIYDSTYQVNNFFRDRVFNDPATRNDTPPTRPFVESYFYHLAPGSL